MAREWHDSPTESVLSGYLAAQDADGLVQPAVLLHTPSSPSLRSVPSRPLSSLSQTSSGLLGTTPSGALAGPPATLGSTPAGTTVFTVPLAGGGSLAVPGSNGDVPTTSRKNSSSRARFLTKLTSSLAKSTSVGSLPPVSSRSSSCSSTDEPPGDLSRHLNDLKDLPLETLEPLLWSLDGSYPSPSALIAHRPDGGVRDQDALATIAVYSLSASCGKEILSHANIAASNTATFHFLYSTSLLIRFLQSFSETHVHRKGSGAVAGASIYWTLAR
jgi:hypothetical protein